MVSEKCVSQVAKVDAPWRWPKIIVWLGSSRCCSGDPWLGFPGIPGSCTINLDDQMQMRRASWPRHKPLSITWILRPGLSLEVCWAASIW